MATPVFCCGAECGRLGDAATFTVHWGASTAWTVSTTTVRSGARSFRYNPTASNSTLFGDGSGDISSTTKVWREYIRFATLPDADCIVSWFNYGGVSAAGVGFKVSDSKLYSAVEVGGVITFGASGVSVTTGQWYRVDAKTVGSVVTGTSDVQIDGSACGQATGAFASDSATAPERGSNSVNITADIFFEDYLLSRTGADYPLGAGYVNHFIPTADGTHNIAGANDYERGTLGTDITNATTDAYLLIDEVPLDDTTPDADDFINQTLPTTGSYTEHIFGPAAGITTPTTGPRTVECIIGIHQAGTGTGNMQVRLNDNGAMGTIYDVTTVAGTTTITYKRAHFADPPSAASVWNAANDGGDGDFRDVRIRFGSNVVDTNPDQYLDCVMLEAEFAEVAAVDALKLTRYMGVPHAVLGRTRIGRTW